jgi:hypothetical protein
LEEGDLRGCVDAHRKHLESGLKAALDTLHHDAKVSGS